MPSSPKSMTDLARLAFERGIPHVRHLGIVMTSCGDGRALLRLPWRDELVGNPDTGVPHGGVITTLIDTGCGMAIFTLLSQPVAIATIDLRIDHLKPAEPGRDIQSESVCIKLTRSIAFVRANAYHDDPANAVAHAVATFMIGSSDAPLMGRRKTP